MSTSGTATFKLDVDGLIEEAVDRIGGEVSPGYESRSARRSLNLLFADMANRGVNLWAVDDQTFTVTQATAEYTLPADTIDVLEMWVRRNSVDVQVLRWSRAEWTRLPNKTMQGKPVQYYIDRARAAPVVTLWPVPENSTDTVHYTRQRRLEDVLTMGNDVDIPVRFMPAIASGLAWMLADKRSATVPQERRLELRARYDEELLRAMEEDREKVSLFVRPWRA